MSRSLRRWFDPRAEWVQIYRETWRIQRDTSMTPRCTGRLASSVEKYARS